jgi:hypothetical protein
MNYKNFYNAWQGFAKPKRQLLVERTEIPAHIKPEDFLALTADAAEMEKIKKSFAKTRPDSPEIVNDRFTNNIFNPEHIGTVSLSVNIDPAGNAKVINHEGRHRCYAVILYNEKVKKKIIDGQPIEKVNLDIIVPDKEGAKIGDIKQFTSAITSAVVSRFKVFPRDVTFDEKNPLRLKDDSMDFTGYSFKNKYDFESDGFRFRLQKMYNNDNALRDKGYDGFVKAVNDAYTITDSSGNTYELAKTLLYPDKNERTRGLIYLNLQPHPVAVHGSIEAANKQTYTIKKKLAQ